MKIYHYNGNNVYTHSSDAKKSPLDNEYLVPARATAIPVPQEINEGHYASWNGKEWQIKEDKSGMYTKIDEKGFVMENVNLPKGVTPDETLVKSEVPTKLEKAKWNGKKWVEGKSKKEKWAEIRAVRNAMLMQTDWTQMGDVILPENKKTDYQSYRQYLRDIPAANANPFKIKFKTYEEYQNEISG